MSKVARMPEGPPWWLLALVGFCIGGAFGLGAKFQQAQADNLEAVTPDTVWMTTADMQASIDRERRLRYTWRDSAENVTFRLDLCRTERAALEAELWKGGE